MNWSDAATRLQATLNELARDGYVVAPGTLSLSMYQGGRVMARLIDQGDVWAIGTPAPDPRTINQTGDALAWTAVYMEHGARVESPCACLDDAVGLLLGGAENGLWACTAILGPDGAVRYAFDETMGIHDLAEQMRGGGD